RVFPRHAADHPDSTVLAAGIDRATFGAHACSLLGARSGTMETVGPRTFRGHYPHGTGLPAVADALESARFPLVTNRPTARRDGLAVGPVNQATQSPRQWRCTTPPCWRGSYRRH